MPSTGGGGRVDDHEVIAGLQRLQPVRPRRVVDQRDRRGVPAAGQQHIQSRRRILLDSLAEIDLAHRVLDQTPLRHQPELALDAGVTEVAVHEEHLLADLGGADGEAQREGGLALVRQRNGLRPPDMLLPAIAIRHDPFQRVTVRGAYTSPAKC